MKQDTAAKTMIITSCVYFGLALTMGLLTALKFVVPTVGEIEYLSMPRVRMLHTNINLFGWLLQANLGILLWILLIGSTLYCMEIIYRTNAPPSDATIETSLQGT